MRKLYEEGKCKAQESQWQTIAFFPLPFCRVGSPLLLKTCVLTIKDCQFTSLPARLLAMLGDVKQQIDVECPKCNPCFLNVNSSLDVIGLLREAGPDHFLGLAAVLQGIGAGTRDLIPVPGLGAGKDPTPGRTPDPEVGRSLHRNERGVIGLGVSLHFQTESVTKETEYVT